MKGQLIGIIILIISIHFTQLFFPWWTIIGPSLIIGFIVRWSQWKAFFWTFIAVAVWYAIYTVWIDLSNDGILSSRLSQLFNDIGKINLIVISALSAALICGLAAGFGASLRPVILSKNT